MRSGLRHTVHALLWTLAACGGRTELGIATFDAGPLRPGGHAEQCNGIDDDFDSLVDEDIPPITCGVGACRRDVPGCEAGVVGHCTPGPGSVEICNRIDDDCDGLIDEGLGIGAVQPPIVVRSTEGSTGGCTTCGWAGGAQLWINDTGMLAVWRLGFNGSHPLPNAYARRLDDRGQPVEAPFVLFETNVPKGFRLSPVSRTRAVLAFCGRFGHEDVMASAFLPSWPVTVNPQRRNPPGVGCGTDLPGVVWSGEVALFSWISNLGNSNYRAILLDIVDQHGESVDSQQLVDEGGIHSAPPRFARGHDLVAMITAAGTADSRSHLIFFLFDAGGSLVLSSKLDPPTDARWKDVVIAPSAEGWMVMGTTSPDSSRFVLRLSVEGEVIDGPSFVEPEVGWRNLEMEPFGREFLLAGFAADAGADRSLAVMKLDEEGRQVDLWRPDPPESMGLPGLDLVVDDGRVWIIYGRSVIDDKPNDVVLWELGCSNE